MKYLLAVFCLSQALNGSPISVTLIGNNTVPGFVELDVNGTIYESMDYSGQRYSSQGDTWQADVFTAALLPTLGYYGPNDPVIMYSNYLARYNAWEWLFEQLETHPGDAAAIQDAAYYISDPTGPYTSNSWVTAALGASPVDDVDGDTFEFVDSPLAKDTVLKQGFIIEVLAPEPGTFLLLGGGLLALGWRKRIH